MSTGTTQAKIYTKITVVDPAGEIWDVSPFDDNGKVVTEQYIDIDMAVGNLTLNLPDLGIFNRVYGTKIYINVVNGGLTALALSPYAIDQQIGSAVGTIAGPAITGLGFVFNPLSPTEWSCNITL